MTLKQFRNACAIAREFGIAKLPDGCTLHYTGKNWSIKDSNNNTVDVAYNPSQLEYIYK